MKSIIVKKEDGVACYMSGTRHQMNEKGEWEKINETDEEMLQTCYQSLIDDVRRKEFDKTMIKLILGYLKWEEIDTENIKIVIDGSKRHCEMNISVTTDWSKATVLNFELPENT